MTTIVPCTATSRSMAITWAPFLWSRHWWARARHDQLGCREPGPGDGDARGWLALPTLASRVAGSLAEADAVEHVGALFEACRRGES